MKITIAIEDEGESGAAVSTTFEPPIQDDTPMTAAAALALRVISIIPTLARLSNE